LNSYILKTVNFRKLHPIDIFNQNTWNNTISQNMRRFDREPKSIKNAESFFFLTKNVWKEFLLSMYVLYDRIVIDSHLSEEGSKLSHKIIYYIDLIKLILWALIILFDSCSFLTHIKFRIKLEKIMFKNKLIKINNQRTFACVLAFLLEEHQTPPELSRQWQKLSHQGVPWSRFFRNFR